MDSGRIDGLEVVQLLFNFLEAIFSETKLKLMVRTFMYD